MGNNPTYREQRFKINANTIYKLTFYDTKPNVITFVSSNNTPVYVSESSNVGINIYDIIIPPYGTRVYAKPNNMNEVFLFAAAECNMFVSSMEMEYNPTMVAQTQEIVSSPGGGLMGVVNVKTIIDQLPAGVNHIGSVTETNSAAILAQLIAGAAAQASEVTAAAILAKLNDGIDTTLTGSSLELYGKTIADRPAANTVAEGTTFTIIDANLDQNWISDGTNWLEV